MAPRYDSDTSVVQCPVCKAILGRRDVSLVFEARCKECQFIYIWKPYKDIPRAINDKNHKGPVACDCGRCGR